MIPLFLDIGPAELGVLVVLAVVLFGPERLPDLARKTARVIRYVRGIANDAQSQLSKELGPGFEDLDLRDLNPRAFVQKHLLDDVEPVVADLKRELSETSSTLKESAADVRSEIDGVKQVNPGGPHDVMAEATPVSTPFDPEST